MQLRDYRYLDREKLDDYLSSMDLGTVESLKETIKTGESPDTASNPPRLGAIPSQQAATETTNERVLSISAKNSFSRLYDAINPQLERFDNGLNGDTVLQKNQLIEVSCEFEVSPVNQMIDSMTNLIETMQNFSFLSGMEEIESPESQQVIQLMSTLFSGGNETSTTPMISQQTDSPKILFLAQDKYILGSREDFEGELTLVGKVTRIVSDTDSVDMLELLKVLPRSLRRGGMAKSFRETMIQAFEEWPTELGGAIQKDALDLVGPAYIITPLAVYT